MRDDIRSIHDRWLDPPDDPCWMDCSYNNELADKLTKTTELLIKLIWENDALKQKIDDFEEYCDVCEHGGL